MTKEKLQNIYNTRTYEHHFLDLSQSTNIKNSYIPINLLREDKNTKEKYPIDSKKLLGLVDNPSSSSPSLPVRTVVIGESGSGKSTLTDEVVSLYGENEFYSDKIEHTFKVKLSLLLDTKWQSIYGTQYIDNPLSCFIHYSLSQVINKKVIKTSAQRFSLEEIDNILLNEKDKLLLIMDGYDAVAKKDETDPDIRKFMDDLLDSAQYIIMTSRPGFLSLLRENHFESRVFVNGFDSNGVKAFVQKYFETQQAELIKIINQYSELNAGATGETLVEYLKKSTNPLHLEAIQQLNRVYSFSKSQVSTPEPNSSSPKSIAVSSMPEITERINSYYSITQIKFSTLLQYQAIKDLASNPMNTALLCLAVSDPEISIDLTSSFTIHKLYRAVMIMLGKRFVGLDQNNAKIDQDFPEFKAFKEMAYFTFTNNHIISGVKINQIAERYNTNVEKLYNAGLLKVVSKSLDGSGSSGTVSDDSSTITTPEPDSITLPYEHYNLNIQDFSFTHASFEEYLAAFHIKTQLASNEPKVHTEAAKFVAWHRNEPQYLLLLKFLAGMLSYLPQNYPNAQIAITRFWEAIECNIEGILELGVDKKVTLFMNLLTQTHQNGSRDFDPRIPNLEKVIKFIDKVILEAGDFIKWQEKITSIGYLSANMEKFLWSNLEKDLSILSDSFGQGSPPSNHANNADSIIIAVDDYNLGLGSLLEYFPLMSPEDRLVARSISNNEQKLGLDNIGKMSPIDLSQIGDSSSGNGNAKAKYILKIKAIIEIAGNSLINVDNVRLYNSLIKNLAMSGVDWHIVKSSINILIKIIKSKEIKFQDNLETAIETTVKKLIPLIQEPNLKETVYNALETISDIYAQDNQIIALMAGSLISLVEGGHYSSTLNNLISGVLLKLEGPKLIAKIDLLISFLEPHEKNSFSSSSNADHIHKKREISDGSFYQLVALTRSDSVHNIIENYLKLKNDSSITISIIEKLIKKLHDTSYKNKIALSLGKILMLSDHATLEKVFNQVIQDLENDKTTPLIIDSINTVINEDQKMSSNFAAKFLTILQNLLNKQDQANKDNVVNAIYKIAKIAENIEDITRIQIYETLLKFEKSLNIPQALAQIVPVSNTQLVQNVFSLLMAQLKTKPLQTEDALIQLTQRNIDKTAANYGLDALKSILDEYASVVAIPIANLVNKLDIKGDQGLNNLCDRLILFIDSQNSLKIVSALEIMMKGNVLTQTAFITKLVAYLDSNINSLSAEINCSIVKLMTSNINSLCKRETENIWKYINLLVNQETSDNKILAREISSLYSVSTEHLKGEIIKQLNEYLVSPNPKLLYIASSAFSKILNTQDFQDEDNHFNLLSNMINLLKNEAVGLYAVRSVISILRYKEDQEAIKPWINTLIPDNQDRSLTAGYSAYIISKVIDKVQIEDQTLNLILTKLRLLTSHTFISRPFSSEEVKSSMTQIIQAMSLKISIPLLKIGCPQITQISIEVITKKLLEGKLDDVWENNVRTLLNIVGNDLDSDPTILRLHEAASRALQNLCRDMDNAEQNLQWVNNNFDQLVKISKSESEKMMEAVFYYVLSDNKITLEESKFIITCVTKLGFTLTFSVEKNSSNDLIFSIQYASKIYSISTKDPESEKNIYNIVDAVLMREDDLLVQQYSKNEPLFPNSGSGIEIAAIDLKQCYSLIGNLPISSKEYKVHYFYRSDDTRSTPTKTLLLLETREAGYYLAHRISFDSLSQSYSMVTHKRHPNKLGDSDFRKEVFGSMDDYDQISKPRYFVSQDPIELTLEQGSQLIEIVQADRSNQRNSLNTEMHRTKSWFLGLQPDKKSFQPSPPTNNRKRAELVETASKKLLDLVKNVINPDKYKISGSWDIDSAIFKEIRRDELLLIDVERKESDKLLRQKLLDTHDLSKKAQAELAIITESPYKEAFYLEILQTLNAVYIAALSIKSGMVENQDQDELGIVADVLDTVSSHVPLAGIGVKILSKILKGVEEVNKNKKIKIFLNFCKDQEEMRLVAEKIARELALHSEKLQLAQKSTQVVETIATLHKAIKGGISGATTKVATAIMDIVEEHKEDPNVTRGEQDGAKIAEFIIKQIFAEKYKDFVPKTYYLKGSPENDKAHLVIGSVRESYASILQFTSSSNGEASDTNHIHSSSSADVDHIMVDVDGHVSTTASGVKHNKCSFGGCVLMSIDASMDPEYVERQNEAFAKFGEDLVLVVKDILKLSDEEVQGTSDQIKTELPKSSLFKFTDVFNPIFLLKKILYQKELKELYTFLDKKEIQVDITNEKDFKQIFLKIHSDKGGDDKDFIFVNGIREKFKQDVWQDLAKVLEDQTKNVEFVLHKAGVSFKMLDTGVDLVRFTLNPTIINGKSVILDLNYLYTMNYGANKASIAINFADVAYKAYQGQVLEAITQAGVTVGYMIVPTIISGVGGPYAALAYSAVITGHSGYKALQNAHSLYKEYNNQQNLIEGSAIIIGSNNSTEILD